jgi:hypothetical protein
MKFMTRDDWLKALREYVGGTDKERPTNDRMVWDDLEAICDHLDGDLSDAYNVKEGRQACLDAASEYINIDDDASVGFTAEQGQQLLAAVIVKDARDV